MSDYKAEQHVRLIPSQGGQPLKTGPMHSQEELKAIFSRGADLVMAFQWGEEAAKGCYQSELKAFELKFAGDTVAREEFDAGVASVTAKSTTLDNYVTSGIMTPAQCKAIKDAVWERKNILVVGNGYAGKTTLTNAIINYMALIAPQDRLAIIEITRELQCTSENAVLMRAVDHLDHVDMPQLLKAAMSQSLDRILFGEVHDSAALALLKAWTTGHPGGVATIHANSVPEGLIRLEQLVVEATQEPMQTLIAQAVDLIVLIKKIPGVGRRITEVVRIEGYDGKNYLTKPI